MVEFKEGNFNITFAGPLASGKTVAMGHVKKALEAEGYEVKPTPDSERGFEHTLSARWRA